MIDLAAMGDPADPRRGNLGYWNSDAVRRFPDKVAIIDLSRDPPREVTYQELEERLDRFAALIEGLGVEPGERMAMAVSNRFEFVEIMFGAMRAGVVPVPLNTKLGTDTLDFVLRNSEARAIVLEDAANPNLRAIADRLAMPVRLAFGGRQSPWLDYETALQDAPALYAPKPLSSKHLAFLPYTSGSTGKPKGVPLTHQGQCWWLSCICKYWPTPPEARALVAVPFYHKNAAAGAIKPLLAQGSSFVILPSFEPRRFLKALSHYRCTKAGGVPAVFSLLLQERDLIESLDFSALQGLAIGSAPTPPELQDAVETAFKAPVIETYGLTEGGPVMIGPPIDGRTAPRGSCGVAWPEGEVKLVTPDGREHPTDGELWVRNPGVIEGYYKLPDVNAERFADGWLKTGDVFHRDSQGFFFFRGRTDDMFNSGGENVYPIEVENMLLKHMGVASCSVAPIPHRVKGEVPVAMVVRAKGRPPVSEDELKQFCLSQGPAYAHPRRIAFVDELPLNGPGKIDRKVVAATLRAMFDKLG